MHASIKNQSTFDKIQHPQKTAAQFPTYHWVLALSSAR